MDKEDDDGFIPYERKYHLVVNQHHLVVAVDVKTPILNVYSIPQKVDGVRS